jgi:hypothetical protein
MLSVGNQHLSIQNTVPCIIPTDTHITQTSIIGFTLAVIFAPEKTDGMKF